MALFSTFNCFRNFNSLTQSLDLLLKIIGVLGELDYDIINRVRALSSRYGLLIFLFCFVAFCFLLLYKNDKKKRRRQYQQIREKSHISVIQIF